MIKEYADKLYPIKSDDPLHDPIIEAARALEFRKGFQLGAEFAEWVAKEGWTLDEKGTWYNEVKNSWKETTTPELTELFLNDKMKEK